MNNIIDRLDREAPYRSSGVSVSSNAVTQNGKKVMIDCIQDDFQLHNSYDKNVNVIPSLKKKISNGTHERKESNDIEAGFLTNIGHRVASHGS